MIERRDILKAALSAVATGLTGSNGQAESAAPAAPSFSRDTVVDLARALAAKPYSAPPNELRDPFSDLTYEQFVGIKTKPGAAIWSGKIKASRSSFCIGVIFLLQPSTSILLIMAPQRD